MAMDTVVSMTLGDLDERLAAAREEGIREALAKLRLLDGYWADRLERALLPAQPPEVCTGETCTIEYPHTHQPGQPAAPAQPTPTGPAYCCRCGYGKEGPPYPTLICLRCHNNAVTPTGPSVETLGTCRHAVHEYCADCARMLMARARRETLEELERGFWKVNAEEGNSGVFDEADVATVLSRLRRGEP